MAVLAVVPWMAAATEAVEVDVYRMWVGAIVVIDLDVYVGGGTGACVNVGVRVGESGFLDFS